MFKKIKESEEIIKEVTTQPKRPFLKPKEKIINLETLYVRIQNLKSCINDCNYNIEMYTKDIENLDSTIVYLCIDCGNGKSFSSSCSEFSDKHTLDIIEKSLIEHCNSKLSYYKELKQTCEDELDWLESKMKFNNQLIGYIDYNFNPDINHA